MKSGNREAGKVQALHGRSHVNVEVDDLTTCSHDTKEKNLQQLSLHCVRTTETHNGLMSDAIEALLVDLLEWIGPAERNYGETMDAWRTSCPRLPVWEEATDRGLVTREFTNGRAIVKVTAAGREHLARGCRQRPTVNSF